MKNKVFLLCILALAQIFLTGFFGKSYEKVEIKLENGYETEAWFYKADNDRKNIGIVYLHGKRGNPGQDFNKRYISSLRKKGYDVIAPLMPWSEKLGYKGTRQDGLDVITAAVEHLETDKVIVSGLSMGGMAVLQYGTEQQPSKVVGLIPIAPAHDPNVAGKLRRETEADAQRACSLMQQGKGKERESFFVRSGKNTYDINATAEYYCTHYSTDYYPNSLEVATEIRYPIFIVSGDQDRLTDVYSHQELFDLIPSNPKSQHKVLPGKHLSVTYKSVDKIDEWIGILVGE